jgi:hypothetical protein
VLCELCSENKYCNCASYSRDSESHTTRTHSALSIRELHRIQHANWSQQVAEGEQAHNYEHPTAHIRVRGSCSVSFDSASCYTSTEQTSALCQDFYQATTGVQTDPPNSLFSQTLTQTDHQQTAATRVKKLQVLRSTSQSRLAQG